jgi:hypothetical protein
LIIYSIWFYFALLIEDSFFTLPAILRCGLSEFKQRQRDHIILKLVKLARMLGQPLQELMSLANLGFVKSLFMNEDFARTCSLGLSFESGEVVFMP